jgi:hypothetical protein
MIGGSTMPEFIVAIDQITYYAVQAEDEVTAIDDKSALVGTLKKRGINENPHECFS